VPPRLPPTRPSRTAIAIATAGACASLGVLISPALADPDPSTPLRNALVETLRPTFTWGSAPPVTGATYEVLVEGIGVVARTPAPTRTATATVDLPDDSTLVWSVRIDRPGINDEEGAERTIRIGTRPAPPQITGGPSGPTSSATPAFSWSGSRATSAWALLDASAATVQSGTSPTASGAANITQLADGAYTFRVTQTNVFNVEGNPEVRSFTVDTVAPPPLRIVAGQPTPSTVATPAFSWTGVEPGARVTWRVTGAGGVAVLGPAESASGGIALTRLAAGSYVFEARQTDAAGNPSPWQAEPFAVLPSPAASPANTTTRSLPRRNVRNLTPRVGARILSRRPTLRWKGGPRNARLYNVQLFRVASNGTRLVKVHSAFPRVKSYRIPKRAALTRGTCYVWRVWPFNGRRFTSVPLGVSNFCVRRR
jgi:hypothetical protein